VKLYFKTDILAELNMKNIKLKGRPDSNWGLGKTDLILRNFQRLKTKGIECI